MPDGDKIHNRLPWRYQQSYQDICERKDKRSDIVMTLKKALLQDIKNYYGDQPVKYAKRLGEMLQSAIENADKNTSVDWSTLNRDIDRQIRKFELNYYQKQILLRACQSVAREFCKNQRLDTSNLPEALVGRLFQEIYNSNFEERIPLTPNHHTGVDHATVMEYVEAINPDILAEIKKWAKKATLDEGVKKLRRSRCEKEIDFEMDMR